MVKLLQKSNQFGCRLIFLPCLLDEHFFCVCINFVTKQIEYLDNRKYTITEGTFENLETVHYARAMAAMFGQFLVESGKPRGEHVIDFQTVNVEFEWQSGAGDNVDCGCFLMLHMLFYRGKVFDCALSNKDSRIVYRAELLAILLMSPFNDSKNELMAKLENFNKRKDALLPQLLQARKLRAEQEEKEKGKQGKKRKGQKKKVAGRKGRRQETEENEEKNDDAGCSTPAQTEEINVDDYLKTPTSVLGTRIKGTSDGLGCTLDCGEPDPKNKGLSTFVRNNQSLFSKMLKLRKEVADYCFLDDYDIDPSEHLVVYSGDTILTKEDLLTMLPTENVEEKVIECWAMLLNSIAHTDNTDPTMLFFGSEHMEEFEDVVERDISGTQTDTPTDSMFQMLDNFVHKNGKYCNLNADLIYFPMKLEDHYFCVCIDKKKKKVDLLDNQNIPVGEKRPTRFDYARIAAGQLSDYLESKGIEDADKIASFRINGTKLAWKTKNASDEESGCFLMMHMIGYEGELYKSELGKKVQRRLFCAEMTASLVLADINLIRFDVLPRVETFTMRRDQIWDVL